MNEPQIWTIIGVLAAALIAGTTLVTQLLMRTVTAQIEKVGSDLGGQIGMVDTKVTALQSEMVLRFEQVDRRFEEVDRRFEQVDQRFERLEGRVDRLENRFDGLERRFDGLEKKVDGLDRDVQAIVKRVLPEANTEQ